MDKILIIDDNADLRDNFAELLSLNNFEVHLAEDGWNGLLIAKQKNPDIILCDIHMPIMDGFDVFQGIKNEPLTAHIPFVFFTAEADSYHHCRSLEAGADDFLSKSSSEEQFLCAVRCRINKAKEISERRTREKLKHVHDLEVLLNTISHSVRSPLCSSLGLLNLWESNANINGETLEKILNGIKGSTLKLDHCTKAFTEQIEELLKKIRET